MLSSVPVLRAGHRCANLLFNSARCAVSTSTHWAAAADVRTPGKGVQSAAVDSPADSDIRAGVYTSPASGDRGRDSTERRAADTGAQGFGATTERKRTSDVDLAEDVKAGVAGSVVGGVLGGLAAGPPGAAAGAAIGATVGAFTAAKGAPEDPDAADREPHNLSSDEELEIRPMTASGRVQPEEIKEDVKAGVAGSVVGGVIGGLAAGPPGAAAGAAIGATIGAFTAHKGAPEDPGGSDREPHGVLSDEELEVHSRAVGDEDDRPIISEEVKEDAKAGVAGGVVGGVIGGLAAGPPGAAAGAAIGAAVGAFTAAKGAPEDPGAQDRLMDHNVSSDDELDMRQGMHGHGLDPAELKEDVKAGMAGSVVGATIGGIAAGPPGAVAGAAIGAAVAGLTAAKGAPEDPAALDLEPEEVDLEKPFLDPKVDRPVPPPPHLREPRYGAGELPPSDRFLAPEDSPQAVARKLEERLGRPRAGPRGPYDPVGSSRW